MMKILHSLPLLVFLGIAPANAAPLPLDSQPNTQVRGIVNVVFANYLRDRVGAEVQNVAIDLDKDGVGEVVARFVHTGSCSADLSLCRTVILRHNGNKWEIVFDRFADSVEVLDGPSRVPRPIKAHNITWKWNGKAYSPTDDGLGKSLSFNTIPNSETANYISAFGEGAEHLLAAGGDIKVSYASPKLSSGGEAIVLKLTGSNICGAESGCPVRVIKNDGDSWKTVLSAATTGDFLVGNAVREGHTDVVVKTKQGFTVLGWSGESYIVADRVEGVR